MLVKLKYDYKKNGVYYKQIKWLSGAIIDVTLSSNGRLYRHESYNNYAHYPARPCFSSTDCEVFKEKS